MGEPTKPNVPDAAPDDVKKFFDCSGDKMVWKKGKVDWLDLPISPDVSFEHGKGDSTDITITFDLEITKIKFTVNASVNAAGELVVDTSNIPDLSDYKLPNLKKSVDDSVANINAWFKKNGKKIKSATFKKGELTVEKTNTTGAYAPPIVPPTDEDQDRPEPVSNPDPQPVAFSPAPLPGPTTQEWDAAVAASPVAVKAAPRNDSLFRLLTVAALIAVITAGLLFGFVFAGGGSPAASNAPTLIAGSGPTPAPASFSTQAPSAPSVAPSVAAPSVSAAPPPSAVAAPSPSLAVPSVSPAPSVAEVATLERACIQVTHQKLGSFVSYLDFAMWWSGLDVDHFEVTIQGTNDNNPVVVKYDPLTDSYKAQFGLHQAGDVTITNVTAVLTDGSTLDVTKELTAYLAGPTLLVRYPQQDSFGTCL